MGCTTAWSYDAADNGGLDGSVVPLPTSLTGVEAAEASSSQASSSKSSSYVSASHAQMYVLEDGRHVILRVLEPGNAFQLHDINSNACITFQLPGSSRTTRIIPECSVSLHKTSRSSSLQIILLADLGAGFVAYRLLLSDADLQNPGNIPVDSKNASKWCTEQQILPSHVISRSSPVMVYALDRTHLPYDTLALAFSDGTLLKLEWIDEEGRFHETALSRQQSFLSSMRSLLPGRFGSHSNLAAIASSSPSRSTSITSSPEQVVSMTSLSSTCLYTVSRDRKLRIWSIPSNTCLETIQLPANPTTMEIIPSTSTNGFEREDSAAPSLMSSTPIPLMRLFNASTGDASKQHLLVHIPSHQVQTSFFILYALAFSDRGRLVSISPVLEKPCDFAVDAPSSTSYLCDFQVLPGTSGQHVLWTLWNENGQTIVRYSDLEMNPSGEPLALPDPNDTMASVFPPTLDTWHLVSLSPHQTNHSLDIPSAAFDRAYVSLRNELDSANLSTPELAHQVTLCAKEACIDSFVDHLFHPGRYPTSAISAALFSYVKTLTQRGSSSLRIPSRTDGSVSLAQQILDVVGSQLALQEDPMTGALKEDEYIKGYKLEHMKLLALAEDNKRNAKQPLALGVSGTRDLLVFAKAAIAAPVATSWTKAIVAPTPVPHKTPFASEQFTSMAALYRLALNTTTELRKMAPLLYASFEESAVQAVTSPATAAIEDISAELFQDIYETVIDDTTQLAFSAQLKEVDQSRHLGSLAIGDGESSSSLAGFLIHAIASLTASVEGNKSANSKPSSLYASASLAGLVVDDSTEDISGRYEQALSFFVLSVFIQHGLAEPPSSNEDSEDEQDVLISDDESSEILSRAWEVLKGFALAKWLAQHNVATTDLKLELSDVDDDSGDDLMLRLKEMRFKGPSSSTVTARPESILSRLLDCADDETVGAISHTSSLDEASSVFLHRLGFVDWQALSASTLAPISAILLQQGLDTEAMSLISRSPEREEDAALLHLQALIACRKGDIDDAVRAFDKVAAAIFTDDVSLAVLTQVADAGDCDTRSAYYRSIVHELEAQQANLAVAATCLRAINAYEAEETAGMSADERPSWLKDLWYKAFRNFTSIGAFDEAYTTMMGMPSRALQMDALRHLVAVMCEEGAAGILLKYAFVGMQEDLEKCLSFRARNAYPLAQPDYYKILHAWQCLMNDYRGAAATMYQRAKRLSALPLEGGFAVEILTAQCQSYLVAINVLELQAPEKRFVLTTLETPPKQHRRKRIRLMDAKLQDPAMITLEAIKREYTLTLARLQLSRDFPELTGTGQHLDSHGAVALFTQIGAFDLALQAALALGLDMSNIFEHMTLRCIAYSQGILVDSNDEAWVVQDTNASGWEGSLASKAWKLLQLYLQRYDVEGEYRRKVLSVILQEDRRIRLPKALVDWFMEVHPEYLIWKLVEYDLLEDAFVYAHRMLAERNAQLQRNIANTRSEAIYTPYNLLDQLLAVDLDEETVSRKNDLQEQQKKLKDAVEQQHRRMDQVLTVL